MRLTLLFSFLCSFCFGQATFHSLITDTGGIPTFTSAPVATRLSFDSFAVVGSIDMAGNIFVYTLADGAGAPSSATVHASGISQAGAYFNIEVGSLTESTSYDCYVVAESAGGVLQATPTKIDVTTTENLNTTLGSALKLWINTKSRANKTLAGPFSAQVTGFTTDETTAASTFADGASPGKVKHQGKALYFLNASEVMADKAKLNFLHNGNAWTVAFRCNIIQATTTTIVPIFVNNNSTTSKTGISVFYDNRSASSRTDNLQILVSKSSAGNALLTFSLNNFFTQGTWVTVVLKYDGVNTLTVYKNGTSVGTSTATNTPFATTDASDNFYLGRFSTTTTTVAANLLLKDLVITDTSLSDGDRGTVETYLAKGGETFGVCGDANVYVLNGQSNMSGSPSSPPTYLQAEMETYLWSQTDNTASISSAQTFVKLLYGTTQNTGSPTLYGPELEFGYRMWQRMPKMTFLFKFAVSGSPLFVDGTGPDWNVASAANEPAQQATSQISNAILSFKYALDRSATVRGWLWRQGEADAVVGNASYQTDLYDLFNKENDAIYAAGFTAEKGRGVIALVDNTFSPPRTFQNDIVTDQQDFADDYFTDNAGYVGKWLSHSTISTSDLGTSDGVHFTDLTMVELGLRFYKALKDYVNE